MSFNTSLVSLSCRCKGQQACCAREVLQCLMKRNKEVSRDCAAVTPKMSLATSASPWAELELVGRERVEWLL